MAYKLDEFYTYFFSFDEPELRVIIDALIDYGEEDMAAEIIAEMESE